MKSQIMPGTDQETPLCFGDRGPADFMGNWFIMILGDIWCAGAWWTHSYIAVTQSHKLFLQQFYDNSCNKTGIQGLTAMSTVPLPVRCIL